jgi:hypothetical protein
VGKIESGAAGNKGQQIFKKLPSHPANYPIQPTEIPSFYLFCLGAAGESAKKLPPSV